AEGQDPALPVPRSRLRPGHGRGHPGTAAEAAGDDRRAHRRRLDHDGVGVTGALDQVAQWPVSNAAAAVVAADGRVLGAVGDDKREYYLASVTKLLTAYTVLIAVEEGVFELDTPAGPEGATVRDLLAHTAGVAFSQRKVVAAPRTRRLYSSAGFDMLAEALTEHADIAFDTYQQE